MRSALSMVIGLAVGVGGGPASSAQGLQGLDHESRIAATATEAEQRQTTPSPDSNRGISLAVPTGTVSVGHGSVGGEPIYVRRTTVREGMTIVEVSTTPFMPDLRSSPPGTAQSTVRPDQPASW
jgi:hypothetical protein